MNPVAITRSIFLTNTEEARKSGSVPKGKAPFDAALRLYKAQHVFGPLARCRHIGCHDEFGLALGFRTDGVFQDMDRAVHPPDLLRRCISARAAPMSMSGAALHLQDDLQPARQVLPDFRTGCLSVGLTGESTLLQLSQALGPALVFLLRTSEERRLRLRYPLGASPPRSNVRSGRR